MVRKPPSVVAATLLLATAIAGCSDRRGGAPAADVAGGLRRYTVRGEVVKLPAPGVPRALAVRHEAIDDFADASGAVVGMSSMVMTFDVAPAVSLDGVGVGDKVELQLAVGWSPPALRVDALRRLPAETALEFRKARR